MTERRNKVPMKKAITVLTALILLLLAGCSASAQSAESTAERTYSQISQDEAMEMMARDDGHVVVDVRRQDEYDAGHIIGQ